VQRIDDTGTLDHRHTPQFGNVRRAPKKSKHSTRIGPTKLLQTICEDDEGEAQNGAPPPQGQATEVA
jgi:hypothetical protein